MNGWQEEELRVWINSREKEMVRDIASLVAIPSVAKRQTQEPEREDGKAPARCGKDGRRAAEQTQEPEREDGKAPAPCGKDCRRALERMREIGLREGFEADDVDGWCLGLSAGSGATEIGIWNHLDVVPAGDGWIWPPFSCTEKNGYLIGRGVQDNKGPAVAALYAVSYCKTHGILKNIRVRQILGCEEESGMGDVSWYLANRTAPRWSFVADCGFPVCCGEKGHLIVSMKTREPAPGLLTLRGGIVCNSVPSSAEACILPEEGLPEIRVTAAGRGGHAAFPEGTVNAISVLCGKLKAYVLPEQTKRALAFLEALASDGYGTGAGLCCSDAVSGPLTCNPGLLSLEDGRICVKLDIRYPVTVKPEQFLPILSECAAQAGFRLEDQKDSPPYYMEETHPFVRVLMEAWHNATGADGKPFVMGGGTYARHIPNAVAFGPGQERDYSVPGLPEGHGNCHCADEAERLENLKTAIRVYVCALEGIDRWIGGQKEEESHENASDQ